MLSAPSQRRPVWVVTYDKRGRKRLKQIDFTKKFERQRKQLEKQRKQRAAQPHFHLPPVDLFRNPYYRYHPHYRHLFAPSGQTSGQPNTAGLSTSTRVEAAPNATGKKVEKQTQKLPIDKGGRLMNNPGSMDNRKDGGNMDNHEDGDDEDKGEDHDFGDNNIPHERANLKSQLVRKGGIAEGRKTKKAKNTV